MKTSNEYNFLTSYRQYLSSVNVQPATIRNYLSDIRHFWGYTMLHSKNTTNTASEQALITLIFTSGHIELYVQAMSQDKTPMATMNRRLSSLRNFALFCIRQNWISHNPIKHVSNITTHSVTHINEKLSLQDSLNEFRTDEKSYAPQLKEKVFRDITELLTIIHFS